MQIKVKNVNINYELSGKAAGQTVVMSHSLGSDSKMWRLQLPALEGQYRVIRLDTRGHGASDAPSGNYTLEQLAGDALGVLDALQIEKFHWVGISMGGMIGQCLALNHPMRLSSLTLCDTAAAIPPEAGPIFEERIDTARDRGMPALVDGTLERWFTRDFLNKKPPEVELIRDQFLATPVQGYIGCSAAILGLNYMERLAEIDMPTLIIVGEQDMGTPVEASQAMHERIVASKLLILPSAAHLSNIEQSEKFNKALVQFLSEVATRD